MNTRTNALSLLSYATASALLVAACGSSTTSGDAAEAIGTIPEVAAAAGGFETLLGAVTAAGLADDLASDGPFTVFAPTDAAFAALPDGLVESLSTEELTNILLYHVVSGELMAGDVLSETLIPSLLGTFIKVDPAAVSVAGATISTTDIEASNGVIHVIDAVMLPPGTIPEVAAAAGSFTTLLGAVGSAGLDAALSGDGPFTVFAPTDAAFEALPAGTLESLTTEQLSDILLYHVHADALPAVDVVGSSAIAMMNGDSVDVVVGDGGVSIAGATVVVTDIPASNGVIHVIDAVLIPAE